MPFERLIPRPLIAGAIQNYAPIVSGVYGITNAQEWIIIAETDNIQDALITHMLNAHSSVMMRNPTGFVFEACERDKRPARLARLVLEYEPVCNRGSFHKPR